MTTKTIAVGLSGGVDSAVAAAILVEQGYTVFGLTMKIWPAGKDSPAQVASNSCYGPGEAEDIAECEKLARQLGIDYKVIDLTEEYHATVLEYFRSEYQSGRTPNPCIVCNQKMKFGFLLDKARSSGFAFDAFATGHYVRIGNKYGLPLLQAAADLSKDQSYFIFRLESKALGSLVFPLGDLTKKQVRQKARALGIPMADKAESQDFYGRDYTELFETKAQEGDFVDETGAVVGTHRGLPSYTIGQRRGLGLGGGPPRYVKALDARSNRVIVGTQDSLFEQELHARDFVVHVPNAFGDNGVLRARAKIRQNHVPVFCSVECTSGGDGDGTSRVRIRFDEPVRAIAPGQFVVLYDDDYYIIGGGCIESAAAMGGDS